MHVLKFWRFWLLIQGRVYWQIYVILNPNRNVILDKFRVYIIILSFPDSRTFTRFNAYRVSVFQGFQFSSFVFLLQLKVVSPMLNIPILSEKWRINLCLFVASFTKQCIQLLIRILVIIYFLIVISSLVMYVPCQY